MLTHATAWGMGKNGVLFFSFFLLSVRGRVGGGGGGSL